MKSLFGQCVSLALIGVITLAVGCSDNATSPPSILSDSIGSGSTSGLDKEATQCLADPPEATLELVSKELVVHDGVKWIRYELAIANALDYPQWLFDLRSDLGDCEDSTVSSRTIAKVYDLEGSDQAMYCELDRSEMKHLEFELRADDPQPKGLYMKFLDRECNVLWGSNSITIRSTADADRKVERGGIAG